MIAIYTNDEIVDTYEVDRSAGTSAIAGEGLFEE